MAWPLAWTALFVLVTVWNLFVDTPDGWWLGFWRAWLWVFTAGALAITVWFTIGGVFDLLHLFRRLKTYEADPADDDRVTRV